MLTRNDLTSTNPVVHAKAPLPPEGGSNPTGNGTFIPGLGGNAIVALLAAMAAMAEASIISRQLKMDQLQVASDLALKFGKATRDSANEDAKGMRSQAIGQIVGGVVSGVISIATIVCSIKQCFKTGDLDAQVKSAQSYREYLDDDECISGGSYRMNENNANTDQESPQANRTRISDEDIDALKNKTDKALVKKRNFFRSKGYTLKDIKSAEEGSSLEQDRNKMKLADPEQRQALKDAFDKKIENLENTRATVRSRMERHLQNATNAAGAISQLSQGSGGMAAATHKVQQGVEDANKQIYQQAMSQAQTMADKSGDQSDRLIGQAFDITQQMAGISNADKSVNS